VTKAKPRRRWLPHAIGAGSLALLAFLGGAAPEFLSDEFKAKFAPYNKWIVGFIILAAIVEVVCAFVIARRSASEADPPTPPANTTTGDRNVSIAGSSSGSTIVTGDHNVVATATRGDVVAGDKITHIHHSPEPVVNPLHQLLAPPHDFIGREQELSDLLDRLGQGVTISGMQGLGGIGKTALALVLAERIKPRYPDAQFYLDLQGASDHPLSTEDAMRRVIRAYHPATRLPESLAELAAIYRSVLHGQRALLLMDNAASRQQVEPLIPPGKDCVLLVTSRRQFALPGMHARNLDELPREDSIRLLHSIAARIGEHADEIARLCGDLPLALRVAGAALAETRNLAPAEYARRLGDQRLRHLPDVEAALNVSYEMLEPEQQQWWSALGVFPASFDDAAAGAVWQMPADAARDALAGLMRWSLVEFDEDAVRYRLHDLARLFAAERLEDAAARQRFAQHYCSVLDSCKSLYKEGGESVRRGLELFDREWANIRAGQAWAAAGLESDPVAAELCVEYPNAGIYVLDLRQHPREKIGWLETQFAAARRLKRRDHEGVALGNLGVAWKDLGETRKAIEFYEQAIAIAREIGDRRGEGIALWNLSLSLDELGERAQAIALAEAALAIHEAIEDPWTEKVRQQLAEWRGQ
ncbi:MAG: ATP-binding protein, partial [Blastocatellia bacterium]